MDGFQMPGYYILPSPYPSTALRTADSLFVRVVRTCAAGGVPFSVARMYPAFPAFERAQSAAFIIFYTLHLVDFLPGERREFRLCASGQLANLILLS